MSRVRLDNCQAQGLVIESLFKMNIAKFTNPANNFQLSDGMPPTVLFDVSGGAKTVLMPPITTLNKFSQWDLGNVGASNALTIKDPTGTITLATLNPNQIAFITQDGTTFYAFVSTVTSGVIKTETVLLPVTLANLANGVNPTMAIPYNFTLTGFGYRTLVPTTTAAKTATLQAQVNGVNVTGGNLVLTSNTNTSPSANLAGASAITGANVGTVGQTIGFVTSGVTAFTEGSGWIEATLVAN